MRRYLEHDAHVGRQREALAVGQRQQLVVVQHGVEVLHPLGVHVAVEYDPLPLVDLAADVVDYFPDVTRLHIKKQCLGSNDRVVRQCIQETIYRYEKVQNN